MSQQLIVTRKKKPTTLIVVASIVLVLCVLLFFPGSVQNRMIIGKIIVFLLFFALGVVALFIVNNARQWREELAIAEKQMDVLRDEVLVAGMVARAQMAEARERLRKDPEKEQSEIMAGLMKQALPLVSMVLKKEKSAITWGLAGFKLVRGLISYFSARA